MTETAKVALEKVLALRQLTHDNQTKTTRSQNAVLQSLSETELMKSRKPWTNIRTSTAGRTENFDMMRNEKIPSNTADGLLGPKPLRALRDVIGGDRSSDGQLVNRISPARFSKGPTRFLEKLILIAIAKNANPDATGAEIALETLAERCLAGQQSISRALKRMKGNLLEIGYKQGRFGANTYRILWDEPTLQSVSIQVRALDEETDTLIALSPNENFAPENAEKTLDAYSALKDRQSATDIHDEITYGNRTAIGE
jgi:hypothetical protein